MAPKAKSAKISEIKPTAEEEEEAMAFLKNLDAKQKHSKLISMNHFLKANEDPTTSAARGGDRESRLLSYIVHLNRSKDAENKFQRV